MANVLSCLELCKIKCLCLGSKGETVFCVTFHFPTLGTYCLGGGGKKWDCPKHSAEWQLPPVTAKCLNLWLSTWDIYIFFTHYILLMSNAKKEMGHVIEQEQTVSLLHIGDSLCTNATASAGKWHVCILKLDLSIINQQPQSMLAIYHMSKKDWWWKFLSPFFFKCIVAS